MAKEKESLIEHGAVGTQLSGGQISHQWRIDRFLELGFTEADAGRLAGAWDEATVNDRHGVPRVWRTPLHHLKVGKALRAGATHEQVVGWYA